MAAREKNLGSRILELDPGQDQEAGIVDDPREVALALRVRPTDELIAGRALPGAGAEPQQGAWVWAPRVIK